MRRLAVLLTLVAAACGARAGSGPAWPKSAGTDRQGDAAADGGESLQPRLPSAVAAIEASSDTDDAVVPAAPVVAKPVEAGGGAAPAATAPADADTPVMLDFEEEIVIDVTGS
jgi:hypothetical protein